MRSACRCGFQYLSTTTHTGQAQREVAPLIRRKPAELWSWSASKTDRISCWVRLRPSTTRLAGSRFASFHCHGQSVRAGRGSLGLRQPVPEHLRTLLRNRRRRCVGSWNKTAERLWRGTLMAHLVSPGGTRRRSAAGNLLYCQPEFRRKGDRGGQYAFNWSCTLLPARILCCWRLVRNVTFNRTFSPFLQTRCQSCHARVSGADVLPQLPDYSSVGQGDESRRIATKDAARRSGSSIWAFRRELRADSREKIDRLPDGPIAGG